MHLLNVVLLSMVGWHGDHFELTGDTDYSSPVITPGCLVHACLCLPWQTGLVFSSSQRIFLKGIPHKLLPRYKLGPATGYRALYILHSQLFSYHMDVKTWRPLLCHSSSGKWQLLKVCICPTNVQCQRKLNLGAVARSGSEFCQNIVCPDVLCSDGQPAPAHPQGCCPDSSQCPEVQILHLLSQNIKVFAL